MEIAAFVKPDFILNVVPTPKGEFAGIFAGNWVSAWQKGTKLKWKGICERELVLVSFRKKCIEFSHF